MLTRRFVDQISVAGCLGQSPRRMRKAGAFQDFLQSIATEEQQLAVAVDLCFSINCEKQNYESALNLSSRKHK